MKRGTGTNDAARLPQVVSPGAGGESARARLTTAGRGLAVLLFLAVATVLSVAPFFPTRVTPTGAPTGYFSAERALKHLSVIAQEPHPSGSPAQARVRDYLVQQLTAIGLKPELQRTQGLENVVARLSGSNPSGAIVLLAHYDSVNQGPGAADNGSAVCVLLETMRALQASPGLGNDVIALFDDSEEYGPFRGTWAFVNEHPWMADVRMAIGMDTAVAGPISTDSTGPDNGVLVQAMARAFPGGVWMSATGSAMYDNYPFLASGIQTLELEDNYPFHEQHSASDVSAIVGPASMQQLGDQALALVRELGNIDLNRIRGEHETYFSVPALGLVHYPQSWSLPLALAAVALTALLLVLSLRKGLVSWRGLLIGLGVILGAVVISAVLIGVLATVVPGLAGWRTAEWPQWPETIPPSGGIVFSTFGVLVAALTAVIYWLSRRRVSRTEFAIAGLLPILILAVLLSAAKPAMAFVAAWPALLGALVWTVAALIGRTRRKWMNDAAALLAALPVIALILPLLLESIMGDGYKNLALQAAIWALALVVILPAVDGLFPLSRMRTEAS